MNALKRFFRFVWRWVVPALLAAGAVACVLVAQDLDAEADDVHVRALQQGEVATPLLSARRLPTVVAEPVALRRLQDDLDGWLAASPLDSCLVVHTADGNPAFEHRGTDPVVPASTEKLLTSTAALLELGPDHRFRTVVATADPAAAQVAGDLYLVGGGDPILATEEYVDRFTRQPQTFTSLDELADRVVDAGVRRIGGSVVGDERRYDQTRYVSTWPSRYIDQSQIGPMSGLALNDGFERRQDGPDAPVEYFAAPDPAANAAAELTRLLRARGVEVVGEPRSGTAPGDARELAAIQSVPLVDVIGQLLRESDNNTGELLLKEIGLVHGGAGSTPQGADAVEEIIASADVPAEGLDVDDGSGLSLNNRVTCDLLVELLERPETGSRIVANLSVAGVSGTLSERFGEDLEGKLRGKTGTLNTVTALAGVLDDTDGRLTFSYVANVPEPEVISAETVALQDGLASILLGWPRTPDVEVLGPEPAER